MADEPTDRDEPTQETTPKKGKPAEIPVPEKRDVFDALRKVATPPKSRTSGDRS